MKGNFSDYFEPSYVMSSPHIPRLKNDVDKFPAIAEELKKYSSPMKDEFNKVFPSKGGYGICYVQDFEDKKIIIKGRQVGPTTAATVLIGHISFSSEEDFWNRWNRFKKLKAFL